MRPGRGGSSAAKDGLLAGGPLEGLDRRLLRWLKAHALDVLQRETREYRAQGRRHGVADRDRRSGVALGELRVERRDPL